VTAIETSSRSIAANADESRVWRAWMRHDVLEIAFGCGPDAPQYVALHTDSGFLRVNTGPDCGWGTSVIVLPSFWQGGLYRQGAPLTTRCRTAGSCFVVAFEGTVGPLRARGTLRIDPPADDRFEVRVDIAVDGHVAVDARVHEAFKPVALSSMHIDNDRWDAATALVGRTPVALASSGWLFDYAPPAARFGLGGGCSRWKASAPTVTIELDSPLRIAGWKTPSDDPNDDNLSIWAATDCVIPSWGYRVVATKV
jgi:hypothetical protein